MPDGAMKVDFATIHQAADDCKSTGGEIDALFEQLKSDIGPLTEGWTGQAQEAWLQRQDEWNKALDEMKALLARIATALPQIADAYQDTDSGISKMFGG